MPIRTQTSIILFLWAISIGATPGPVMQTQTPSNHQQKIRNRVFRSADEMRELFEILGLEYLDHVVSSDPSLQNLAATNSHRYKESTFHHTALRQRYRGDIKRRKVMPSYVRWVNDTVGLGLFADTRLEKGQMIGEYTGQHVKPGDVSNGDYAWSYPAQKTKNRELVLSVIDAEHKGNELRFVNHSYEPNTARLYVELDEQWHAVYIATKPIKKGDQILVNYGIAYWEERNIRPMQL